MYSLHYDEQAKEDIKQLDGSIKPSIQKAIEDKLLHNPTRFGKPLRYDLTGARSFRIGDYRVVFDLVDTKIVIWMIAHRKDVYSRARRR